VLALVALVVGLGLFLAAPLTGWIGRLPETIPLLQQKLSFLSGAIRSLRGRSHICRALRPRRPGAQQIAVAKRAARRTPSRRHPNGREAALHRHCWCCSSDVSGETFLRHLVEILPRFKDKKQLVDIPADRSRHLVYLATITMMNYAGRHRHRHHGLLCGLGRPDIMGTLAFLLNYVPVLAQPPGS